MFSTAAVAVSVNLGKFQFVRDAIVLLLILKWCSEASKVSVNGIYVRKMNCIRLVTHTERHMRIENKGLLRSKYTATNVRHFMENVVVL